MFDSDCNYRKLKHSLNLYEDENNILCSKSKFDSLETFNHDQKNPILLRSHSLFTDLVILKFHEKCCHSGANATLNSLCRKLWIVRGRQTVKKYLKKCVRCKIVQGKTLKLGHFLLKRKTIPKDVTFYYLLVQLLERDTWNYVETLALRFLF